MNKYEIIELGMIGDTCYYRVKRNRKVIIERTTFMQAVKEVSESIQPGDVSIDVYEQDKVEMTHGQFMARPSLRW